MCKIISSDVAVLIIFKITRPIKEIDAKVINSIMVYCYKRIVPIIIITTNDCGPPVSFVILLIVLGSQLLLKVFVPLYKLPGRLTITIERWTINMLSSTVKSKTPFENINYLMSFDK